MIVGIGTDLIEIARIKAVLDRFPERFRQRCFTEEERAYCDGKAHAAQHFAARFAAKEAAFKAIGTGLRGVGWRDAHVLRQPGEAPQLEFTGRAFIHFSNIGGTHVHLTLSHSRELAIAHVVVERRSTGGGPRGLL